MEIFNETCILSISYILIILSDYLDNVKIKNQAGLLIISVVFLNFLVNVVMMAI